MGRGWGGTVEALQRRRQIVAQADKAVTLRFGKGIEQRAHVLFERALCLIITLCVDSRAHLVYPLHQRRRRLPFVNQRAQ